MDVFRGIVDECGLYDLGFYGDLFIWERERFKVIFLRERLNRGLADYE